MIRKRIDLNEKMNLIDIKNENTGLVLSILSECAGVFLHIMNIKTSIQSSRK